MRLTSSQPETIRSLGQVRRVALLTLALLATTACRAEPETRIPFESVHGTAWFEAEVEGRGPFHFALDTGAPLTVLDEALAAKLGLRVQDLGEAVAAGATPFRSGLARNVTLTLAGRRLHFDRVLVVPLQARLSRFIGRPLHGLLGNDITRRHAVEFDPNAHELVLHDPGRRVDLEGGVSVPSFGDGWTFVDVGLRTPDDRVVRGRFLVDTLAWEETAVFVNPSFALRHGLFELAADRPADLTVGLSGPVRFQVARLKSLELGALTIEAPTVALVRDTEGLLADDEFDGILATGLLSRHRILFDRRRERVVFAPTPRSEQPYPYGLSGLLPAFTDDSLTTLVVEAVSEGSPAALGGLEQGDVISSLDDAAIGEASLLGLLHRLRLPNEEIELRVRSGDGERRVAFTTVAVTALPTP